MMWEIVNLVATADFKHPVELHEISSLEYIIYDKKIYGGRVAYLKTPDMHGKVTIFPSGKMISIGTKSQEQAQEDLDFTVKYLEHASIIKPVKVKAKIRNIVALLETEHIGYLEEFAETYGAMYEPEQFPGAILRLEDTNATYNVFASGKIIISGTRSIKELEKAVNRIETILLELSLAL